MDPLATVDELATRLGRTLTDAEEAAAAAHLRTASDRVRRYSTQAFTRQPELVVAVKLRGAGQALTDDGETIVGGRARLPQRPVNSIASVTDMLGAAVIWAWDGGEWITVSGLSERRVRVTYDAGYGGEGAPEMPDDIVGIVCQMVGRALGVPADGAGLQTEQIGGYSYGVGAAAAAGAVGLMNDEKDALAVYRRVGGSLRTGP